MLASGKSYCPALHRTQVAPGWCWPQCDRDTGTPAHPCCHPGVPAQQSPCAEHWKESKETSSGPTRTLLCSKAL